MSDARVIEAVTETLRNLIDIGVKEVEPSAVAVARPPDQISDTQEMQMNLFMYQAAVDPVLRNTPPPDALPGEQADPALPLVLHYLLTPYANSGEDLDAHRMLGGALRILHEHQVLSRTELAQTAPYSDVSQQLERVRISWQTLEEKDIFSLWSVFQTPYRVSAAFEVRVALIDSRRNRRTPVPALRRGADDFGPVARANPDLGYPALTAALAPNGQPAALLGDSVLLQGVHLTGAGVSVSLVHPLRTSPLLVTGHQLTARTDQSLRFTLPNQPDHVPAGVWTATLAAADGTSVTNAVPLTVGPQITSAMPLTVARAANGIAVVNLTCEPQVRPGQTASLLLGDRSVPAQPFTAATSTLQFRVTAAVVGQFISRLRVAGVDSPFVDRTQTPPALMPSQIVTVT